MLLGVRATYRIGTQTSARQTFTSLPNCQACAPGAGGVYPLPPEERELPDVLAGRHHQRTQGEHAGFPYCALELRKLCELVARLGVNGRRVHAALAQQEYAL